MSDEKRDFARKMWVKKKNYNGLFSKYEILFEIFRIMVTLF
jgi:hypothetical protein